MAYIGKKPTDKPLTSADLADNIVTSAKIVDGEIVNADVNSSAAIALSKLSTTGTGSSSNYLRGDGAWTEVAGGQITSVGTFFENWNEITTTLNTTLSSTANKFLVGTISITGSGVWTITGTGSLSIL